VYRATVKTGKIEGVFPSGLSQQVAIKDERTAEVTVLAVRPDSPATAAAAGRPTSDDLAPSSYLQSDDPAIVALARSVATSEKDPWLVACALEKHVDATIQLKNFSQAFATAAQVARSLEGDCTEHAMLLAALCRARQIPARCAFGLIYFEPLKGFAFHMWTEVWISDRWVPLDGTLGHGGIAADHLKLGDTSLSGPSSLADLLAVTTAFGRLELQLISAE
jgi:transglutaminase-like putative cysteine protease